VERIIRKALGISASRDDLTSVDESILSLDEDDSVLDEVLTAADKVLTLSDETFTPRRESLTTMDEILMPRNMILTPLGETLVGGDLALITNVFALRCFAAVKTRSSPTDINAPIAPFRKSS
jgi:hypothetical protein